MNATLTAAAAALTAAGFKFTTRTTARKTVLAVACPTLSDEVFTLLDTVRDLGVTVYPAGDEVTTCVAAR